MQDTFDTLTTWSTEDGIAQETLSRQIDMLQAFTGGPKGYRLRRILLTNFWLYGQQDFEIVHGRLFLAGENASGKSTVLMAALPLALDGDIRPNRLDTFGGRERHIEYYVLGGSESATPYNHERRTAYIALEFEWCDPDHPPIAQELRQRWENGEREQTRFLTIGLSLAGNINASDRIRPMRFLITDGSRLGYDLHTLHDTANKHEKRAYDQSRFKQVLEGHGIVCESRDDYEQKVARYLFGFTDVKEYQKLITLLLVLRRPNLSTELNFSKVHDFLKVSLRKISGETTSRVIGTIERIDAIQSEIEHIQEAYSAANRLHSALQDVSLVGAQLAATEYIEVQQVEDSIQAKVNKLRRDLSNTENERDKSEAHSQALQAESQQVGGQVKALEASEGLQVAQRLALARERSRDTRAQMQLQEQNLKAAQQAIQETRQSQGRQKARFEQIKTEGAAHLQELAQVAADESYWEAAASQLQEASRGVNAISLDAPSAPEVPLHVASMLELQSQERITWLHRLEELHKRREQLETKVQGARDLETMRFQELDDTSRRFQFVKDSAYEAQQNLDEMLEVFSSSAAIRALLAADTNDEILSTSTGTLDDDTLLTGIVEQFATALESYRQAIDTLDHELSDLADQLQGELDELQLLTGGKIREVAEARALYEQKLSEPENLPQHSTRRTTARARLAEQGIAALPLYALLDFAPEINSESEEAGRIEYMLEDAGLLDALVIAPHQLAAADTLLAAEDLSDCRLDVRAMSAVGENSADNLGRWLRFDTAVNANTNTTMNGHTDWETAATELLTAIGHMRRPGDNGTMPATGALSMLSEDGTWRHGLLKGHAGGGAARFIGKDNRLRVRQRELDELQERWRKLDEELRWLNSQVAEYEQRRTQLQEKQTGLRKALTASGMEEMYNRLATAKTALDDARSKYQKARVQTSEAKQNFNSLIAQLERESSGLVPLASNPREVQKALMGMVNLKNQARTVNSSLVALSSNWAEYQKVREALANASDNAAKVAHLYDYTRNQALQAQAEEKELEHIAASANVEELGERLRQLRERSEVLLHEIDEVKGRYIRADERSQNLANLLLENEIQLTKARTDRTKNQGHFLHLLAVYPVERLSHIQELARNRSALSAAQDLLGSLVQENDMATLKELLEHQRHSRFNQLLQAFNQEQHLLHDFGPNLDEQGQVLFLYENKSNPAELLRILSERIEMQKNLLEQKERQLFEDFLLQEIAEAIRTHILEAEEWIQQINGVLKHLPMIGEHYELTWKPPVEYDMTKLGSHLARHYKLLRKPSQTLTAEETETLMGAFRQEIETVKQKQEEDPSINFMEVLEQIFDYREWFHFDVWVTPIGGQRQRLTDRLAGTRSGAEQLFALYVPLFAALAAVYKTAAAGAPRLLALDEAFDKVSVANTQRIMEFLVSQDFQWIMTGPQISGTSEKIPASARYLMIHEKGSPVATASASFWAGNQDFQTG